VEYLIDNYYTIYFCFYGVVVLAYFGFKGNQLKNWEYYKQISSEETKLNNLNYEMHAENCKLEEAIKKLSYEKSRISSIKSKLDNF